MPSAFIDDGYTLDGYIAENPGLYPAVEFQYRPMTRRETAVLEGDIMRTRDAEAGETEAAKVVARKLVSWNLVDRAGKPVPISADNLLRLQPVLGGTLLEIVRGRRASDRKPDQQAEPTRPNPDDAAGN
jgi:hypothetical protein